MLVGSKAVSIDLVVAAMASVSPLMDSPPVSMPPRVHRSRVYYDISAVFEPMNLILVLTNLFVFIVIETIFFWEVASKGVVNEVTSFATYIDDFTNEDAETNDDLLEYLNSEEQTERVPEEAQTQRDLRTATNIGLIKTFIVPPGAVVLGILCLLVIVMVFKRSRFTFIDFVLLSTVVFAFTTELIFYLLVLGRWKYLGPQQLLANTVGPGLEPPSIPFGQQ